MCLLCVRSALNVLASVGEVLRVYHRRSVQLEVSRLQLLKHSFRVVLARSSLQICLTLLPIARNDILELAGVVHVHPVVVHTKRNRLLDLLHDIRHNLVDFGIVCRFVPGTSKLDDVDRTFFYIEAHGVTALSLTALQ